MKENLSTPDLTGTRQHFLILDGLRGIASLAVLLFHFMEIAVPDYTKNFVAHAYLAVDFFFCLSGFVIAYAYDERFERIGALTFLKLRLIRLHPLVLIGAVLGILSFIQDPFSDLQQHYTAFQKLLLFISSGFLIPYPLVLQRFANLFHLNPPTWSLFWEYAANIAYALVLIRLRNKWLWVLSGIAALCLCLEAHRSGNLCIGWGGENIRGGGFRVFYSFVVGMLAYRSKWMIKSPLGFLSLSALLTLAFIFPYSDATNRFVDPVFVILYFPFLVALGAGATLRPAFERLCRFLGELSYPLYMIHYPFVWIFFSYTEARKPSLSEMTPVIIISMLFLVLVAWIVLKYVDAPLRNYLKTRLVAR